MRAATNELLFQSSDEQSRFFGHLARAMGGLGDRLKADNTCVAYALVGRGKNILRAPKDLFPNHELISSTNFQNIIIAIDYSNEGPPYKHSFIHALEEIKKLFEGKNLAFIYAQNNLQFKADFFADSHSSRFYCAFPTYQITTVRLLENLASKKWVNVARRLLDRAPSRNFLCLNRKPRVHRLLALLWLADNFDENTYRATFGGFGGAMRAWTRHAETEAKAFLDSSEFDDVLERVRLHGFDPLTVPNNNMRRLVDDIDYKLYEETFASLVTESEMSDGKVIRYTEKMLKPLAAGHPAIVLGNPHTLPILEQMGFDFLRDEIDQSYDAVEDPKQRLEMALRSARRLSDLPQPAWDEFLQRNRSRLAANIQRFDGSLLRDLLVGWELELKHCILDLTRRLSGRA